MNNSANWNSQWHCQKRQPNKIKDEQVHCGSHPSIRVYGHSCVGHLSVAFMLMPHDDNVRCASGVARTISYCPPRNARVWCTVMNIHDETHPLMCTYCYADSSDNSNTTVSLMAGPLEEAYREFVATYIENAVALTCGWSGKLDVTILSDNSNSDTFVIENLCVQQSVYLCVSKLTGIVCVSFTYPNKRI